MKPPHLILSVALAALFAAAAVAQPAATPQAPRAATAPPDAKTIRDLPADQRPARVLAAVRWREDRLRNVGFELTVRTGNVRVPGGERITPPRVETHAFYQRGEKLLGRYSVQGRGAPGRALERLSGWDGSVLRTLFRGQDTGETSGTISRVPDGGRQTIGRAGGYGQMLGLWKSGEPRALTEWTEAVIAAGETAVDVEADGGVDLVVFRAGRTNDRYTQTFWFDPARDFMPVRYEYDDGGNWERHRVEKAEPAGGLWVPTKVVARSGRKASPDFETEMVYEAARVTVGDVTEEQVTLTFPPGTRVTDQVRQSAYRLRPDGSEQPMPYRDPETGEFAVGGKAGAAQPGPRPASRPASRPSSQPIRIAPEVLQARREAFLRRQQQEGAQQAEGLAETIRQALASDPRPAVDQLNRQWMEQLIDGGKFAEVEEFAALASAAVARDTWAVEQLQRHRVRALLRAGKPAEALAAAKGLFFVAGMGSVGHDLALIAECLRAADPQGGGAVARFKLQQLAGAQPDARRRKDAAAGTGESVLAAVEVDTRPYLKAIDERRGMTDFNGLYGTGNLLMLSGRVKEARDYFEHAYAVAPPGELRYATEALAKVIKAEDCAIGRANEFVASVRPR